jgi:hypothetical protein
VQAEEIGLELVPGLLEVGLLQRPEQGIARVVDERVDAPVPGQDPLDGGLDGGGSRTSICNISKPRSGSCGAGLRPVPMTVWPRAANNDALCRPIPDEAPVINRVLGFDISGSPIAFRKNIIGVGRQPFADASLRKHSSLN